MRSSSLLSFILCSLAGPAFGQPAPSGPSAGASADAQVDFHGSPRMSGAEMSSEADRTVAKMEQAAALVRRQLEQARAQKDVIKVLGLNDKLSQIDTTLRSARDRRTELAAAVGRGDTQGAQHAFMLITVLRQRMGQLVAEANQVVGEEAAIIGQSRVVTTIDPTIPSDLETFGTYDPRTGQRLSPGASGSDSGAGPSGSGGHDFLPLPTDYPRPEAASAM